MEINGRRLMPTRWCDSPLVPVMVVIACLLPFLNKAFHIDDPLFMWTAKHICQSPADFYGFSLNWFNHVMRMAEMSPNPPLMAYYLAFAGTLLGWTEVAVHLAFLVPAIVATLGVFYLARRLCSRPVLATLAAILTPGFLVSGTTVMCDMMMLAFWVWAILLWVRGTQGNNPRLLWLAALLIGPCALTKYIGLALIGLLFIYSFAEKRRLGWWVVPLLLPVLVIVEYEWVTHLLYGRGLLTDAAAYTTKYATTRSLQGGATVVQKALMGLTFAGGCAATVFFASPFLWSRKVWAAGFLVTAVGVVWMVVQNNFLAPVVAHPYMARWSFLLQAGFMAATGIGIFSLAFEDLYRHRNAESLLLTLWVLGIFLFTVFLNWTVSARNILTLIPAVGILLARKLEKTDGVGWPFAKWSPAVSLIPAAALAILIAVADTSLANTARRAAAEIPAALQGRGGAIWYEGHWGFQYYIDTEAIRPIDCTAWALFPGDLIIIPRNNTNLVPLPAELVSQLPSMYFQPIRWASAMDPTVGAGFYSHLWGPLPYVFGGVGPEQYFIFVLERLPGAPASP
jgi:4-amino-4-deoxy-L-arabinose transferase-like glycosyltransferase